MVQRVPVGAPVRTTWLALVPVTVNAPFTVWVVSAVKLSVFPGIVQARFVKVVVPLMAETLPEAPMKSTVPPTAAVPLFAQLPATCRVFDPMESVVPAPIERFPFTVAEAKRP